MTENDEKMLLTIARQSIVYGLQNGQPGLVNVDKVPVALLKPTASFVTLKIDNKLRGCVGSIKPIRPLAQDVATNAFLAAFRDHRFPPMTPGELESTTIDISLLSDLETIDFDSEEDLLSKIRPGIDGLVIQENERRGLFLPCVWESLPDKVMFFKQLKIKAGLSANYWSDSITCWRFTVDMVNEKK